MIKTPGLRAQFHDGKMKTNNKRLVERLRGLLRGPKAAYWAQKFQEVPNAQVLASLNKAQKAAEEARKKVIEKEMAKVEKEDAALYEDYDAFKRGETRNKKPEVPDLMKPTSVKIDPPKKQEINTGMLDA